MRISDWSSDVCSADLAEPGRKIALLAEEQVAIDLDPLRRQPLEAEQPVNPVWAVGGVETYPGLGVEELRDHPADHQLVLHSLESVRADCVLALRLQRQLPFVAAPGGLEIPEIGRAHV